MLECIPEFSNFRGKTNINASMIVEESEFVVPKMLQKRKKSKIVHDLQELDPSELDQSKATVQVVLERGIDGTETSFCCKLSCYHQTRPVECYPCSALFIPI